MLNWWKRISLLERTALAIAVAGIVAMLLTGCSPMRAVSVVSRVAQCRTYLVEVTPAGSRTYGISCGFWGQPAPER